MLYLSASKLFEISAYVYDADQLKSKYEEYTEIRFPADFSFNPYNLELIRQLLKAVPIKRFYFDLREDDVRASFLKCGSDPKYSFPTKEFLSILNSHESHFTIQSESIELMVKFLDNVESLRGASIKMYDFKPDHEASIYGCLGGRLNALNVQRLKISSFGFHGSQKKSFLKALCEKNENLKVLCLEFTIFLYSRKKLITLSLDAFAFRGKIFDAETINNILEGFKSCWRKLKVDGFKALGIVWFNNQGVKILNDIHEWHIRLRTICLFGENINLRELLVKIMAYPQYLQKNQTDSLYFPFSCLHLDTCTFFNVPKKEVNNFGLIPEYQDYVQLPYLKLTNCDYYSTDQDFASFKTAYNAFREAQTPFMWGLYVYRILKDLEAFSIGFTDDVLINLFDGFKLGPSWKKKFFKGFCVGYLKHLKENTSGQIPQRLTQLKDVFIPGENNALFFKGCTHFFDQVRQNKVDAEKKLSKEMSKMKIAG